MALTRPWSAPPTGRSGRPGGSTVRNDTSPRLSLRHRPLPDRPPERPSSARPWYSTPRPGRSVGPYIHFLDRGASLDPSGVIAGYQGFFPGVISENTHGMTFRPAAINAHWRCSHRPGAEAAATMVSEGESMRLLTRNGSLKYVSLAENEENAYRNAVVG